MVNITISTVESLLNIHLCHRSSGNSLKSLNLSDAVPGAEAGPGSESQQAAADQPELAAAAAARCCFCTF